MRTKLVEATKVTCRSSHRAVAKFLIVPRQVEGWVPNPLSQCWWKIGFPMCEYRMGNRDVRQLLWRRHRTNADASHKPAADFAMNEEVRYLTP
jgi:hypothetical protein